MTGWPEFCNISRQLSESIETKNLFELDERIFKNMVKLRLRRMGKKGQPFYRIVAADSRSPRDGRFIEEIGTYNPIKKDAPVVLDREAALRWLKEGAQPTDTVRSILSREGVMTAFHDSKFSK